jgi:hypothetical protein
MVSIRKDNLGVAGSYDAERQKRALQLKAEEPSKRTSVGLRNALFDEIDALRRGDGDPHRAMAVSRLAATILDSVRLEVTFKKSGIEDDPTRKPMQLGSDE